MWASNAEIRAQRNAEFGVPCTCPFDASGPWDCTECARCGEAAQREMHEQQEAEIAAENAWLRHAEMPTAEDYAFEQWEAERGLF
jgi:hypothetical protein